MEPRPGGNGALGLTTSCQGCLSRARAPSVRKQVTQRSGDRQRLIINTGLMIRERRWRAVAGGGGRRPLPPYPLYILADARTPLGSPQTLLLGFYHACSGLWPLPVSGSCFMVARSPWCVPGGLIPRPAMNRPPVCLGEKQMRIRKREDQEKG